MALFTGREQSYVVQVGTPIDSNGKYIQGDSPGYSEAGATRVIRLQEHLPMIPANAYNVKATLLSASIWNTTPNVSRHLGENSLTFSLNVLTSNQVANPGEHERKTVTLVFEDGLYSLEELQDTIRRLLANRGLDQNCIMLAADYPQGKIEFATQYMVGTGGVILHNPPSTLRTLLGFPQDDSFTFTLVPGDIVLAPLKATFNRLNWYELVCSLSSPGMKGETKSRNLLAQIYPSSNPNSMIVYDGPGPAVDASDLKGVPVQEITVQWFSDSHKEAPTYNPWNVCIEVSWVLS